jgi:dTDP-4-amino-4,6-dideoxygalactose transaminase
MNQDNIAVPFVSLSSAFKKDATEISNLLIEVGESGQYILGSKLSEFENDFAKFVGSKYAIGVANGSDALFLIMKALGIGPGDEVITQPNSFIATAWTIIATGAKPVFCEVDETLGLDPNKLLDLITPKTKAVIPVHLAGNPTRITETVKLLKGTSIHIIEDAAQAIGAEYEGQKIGTFGIAAGFSLHPLKNLGVLGDGGVISTSNLRLYKDIIKLRNHGLINRDQCEIWGFNSRLDEFQAGIAMIRLRSLDSSNKRLREIAGFYSSEIAGLVDVPKINEKSTPVYHNYIIHLKQRDLLRNYLSSVGIETKVHYPIPIHLQECSKNLGYKVGSFPVCEYQSTNSLSLPIYPELSDDQISKVVVEIKNFFKMDL